MAKKQVSRQTLWQRKHREMGLCVVCSEPAYKGWRCVKHYEQHKINMRFRYVPKVRGRYNVGAKNLVATEPKASKDGGPKASGKGSVAEEKKPSTLAAKKRATKATGRSRSSRTRKTSARPRTA